MPSDKRQLYEFDVRVPLMIRGPNVTPGRVVKVILFCLLTLNPTNPRLITEASVNVYFRGFRIIFLEVGRFIIY